MKDILKEIQDGKLPRSGWMNIKLYLPEYNRLLEEGEKHQIEETGGYLRDLMPWVPKRSIKGAQASYR